MFLTPGINQHKYESFSLSDTESNIAVLKLAANAQSATSQIFWAVFTYIHANYQEMAAVNIFEII